jgi:hypothetical protein
MRAPGSPPPFTPESIHASSERVSRSSFTIFYYYLDSTRLLEETPTSYNEV